MKSQKIDRRTLVRFKPKSLLKIERIYKYYKQLQDEVEVFCPEIVPYVSKKYYYEKVSEVFGIGANHLSTVINRIESDPKKFQKEVELAKKLSDKNI